MQYLASPYSHPDKAVMKERFDHACNFAAKLLRKGLNVFSPIAHSHPIAGYGLPTEWSFWRQVDTQYIKVCKNVLVYTLPEWEKSVGVNAEIVIASKMGKPVWRVNDDFDIDELVSLCGGPDFNV